MSEPQRATRPFAGGGLTPISDALELIRKEARPLPVVQVSLAEAAGLTLAEPIVTDVDYPPFDKAMMDGFAVRAADCDGKTACLEIVGEVAAGETSRVEVQSGQALRINTGAPMPRGADSVLMIEKAAIAANGRTLRTDAKLDPGKSVSPRASDATAGQMVLPAGIRLGAAQIAAAAAAGASQAAVYRRPRLSVLVTGDELVDVSVKPAGGQIRNSNGPCLAALARQAGCETVDLGVAADDPEALKQKLALGLASDVFCISGGMSMGQHDYVPGLLREAGVRVLVQKIAMKPGKPSLIGVGPAGQWVFGLPGNPASAFVCFFVFVRAGLQALQGRPVTWPSMTLATLGGGLNATGSRCEWIPAEARLEQNGTVKAMPVRWTGSGDVFGLGRSNALIYRDSEMPALDAGANVAIALTDLMI